MRFDFSHGANRDRPEPMLTLTEPPAFSGACMGRPGCIQAIVGCLGLPSAHMRLRRAAVEIQQSSRSWHLPSSPHAVEWLCLTLRPEPAVGPKGGGAHGVGGELAEPAVKRARG